MHLIKYGYSWPLQFPFNGIVHRRCLLDLVSHGRLCEIPTISTSALPNIQSNLKGSFFVNGVYREPYWLWCPVLQNGTQWVLIIHRRQTSVFRLYNVTQSWLQWSGEHDSCLHWMGPFCEYSLSSWPMNLLSLYVPLMIWPYNPISPPILINPHYP